MQTLNRADAKRILAHHTIGRLGCFSPEEDKVYIVPISYRVRGQTVYFSCLPGQKVDFLRAHPKGVCLEVDHIRDEQDWVSVVAMGYVQELSGFEYLIEERPAVGRANSGPLRWNYLDDTEPRGHRLLLFGLRVEQITGRRDCWWAVPERPQPRIAAGSAATHSNS